MPYGRKQRNDPKAAEKFEAAARRVGARMRGEPEAEETRLAEHAEDATCANDDEAWGKRMMREGARRRGERATTRSTTRRAADAAEESFDDVVLRARNRALGKP